MYINPNLPIHFTPFPDWCSYIRSLYLCLYFCLADKFICIIFLGSMYKWHYMMFFSFWLPSLCTTGSRFIHLTASDSNSFLISHCMYVPFCVCAQSCLTMQPCTLYTTRLLCPGDFSGKNPGMGFHCLLQGIFPTQDWTRTSYVSSTAGRIFYHWAIRKPYICTTAYLSIHLSVDIWVAPTSWLL